MNKFEFKNLSPFKWFVLENFPFIEADFDALTDWQLYCKLGKEINKIIESQNVVGTEMEKFSQAFIELQNYVDNYFKNLDVQDEINNKLNEMAEDGTLQDIISAYLNSKAIFGFNNVESMKNATNLIDGSYARTLGYYNKNDGGNALYKIRTITNNDIVDEMFILSLDDDTLVAELICDEEINLKQLGLKGDGTTDETTKLQNAFSKTYNIFINKGTYITNDEIKINTSKTIKGDIDSLIKAKAGMKIDKAIIKITCDDVTLDNVNLSGNIEENPIGDVYNDSHGISLIDIYNVSNIKICNCHLFDNAYTSCRIRGLANGTSNLSNIHFYNNKCNNVDCGIIFIGNSNIQDVYIHDNLFDGHIKSEAISIFNSGNAYNINITNNIIKNKNNGSGILVGRSNLSTNSKKVVIANNIIIDVASGINIRNGNTINISNNQILGDTGRGYVSEGIVLLNANNININNNYIDKVANEGIKNENCQNITINDNVINNENINENPTTKSGISIKDSSYINCKNNLVKEHTNSSVYSLDGAVSYININEAQNSSLVSDGILMNNLTESMTNSKILTNLSIRGNFTNSYVSSNTNEIKQTYATTGDNLGLPYKYKFAREITLNVVTNRVFSTFNVYNLRDIDIYTINIRNHANITLTSNTTDDFGVKWKEDKTLSTGYYQLKLMYYEGKLYEI